MTVDEFTGSVVSQDIHVNVMDITVTCYNTQLISFYENSAGDADFMDSTKLERGFYRALSALPVYAGEYRVCEREGVKLVVDKNNLNMPGYLESTSDILFGSIKASNYNPKSWPPGLMSDRGIPLPDAKTGKTKMLSVHIIRFRDNSGVALFVSGCHGVADGEGFYRFIQRWADETRVLVDGTPAPTERFHFDRAILLDSPDSVQKVLDPNRVAYLQSVLSTSRNQAIYDKIVADRNEGNLYRVDRDILDNLRNEVLRSAPDGTRLSTNDVLAALISKTLAQATKEVLSLGANQVPAPIERSDAVHLQKISIPYNVRPLYGAPAVNYVGNALILPSFAHSLESGASETTSESLADVAVKIRNAVNSVQKNYATEYYSTLERSPTSFAPPLSPADTAVKSAIVITSHVRFKIYSADFGYGIPDFATPRPYLAKVGVKIQPVRPPSRDLYVSFVDTPAMIHSIRKNRFWSSVAEVVF